MLKTRNEIIHAVKKHHKKLIVLKRVLKNIGQIPNTNLSQAFCDIFGEHVLRCNGRFILYREIH